ncbi:unnamed protein product [Darwinula stevensoni]|uniref:Uncharacterized protein n=1 Tax=Darwinula stevensoni TaxID=69355 RepID=A0A7R9AHH3_9CRUS|nr:unnamed protein product [Darwinula stevensoni]CAG0904740.1 unnamed protein product [Darwinula stevensoni]
MKLSEVVLFLGSLLGVARAGVNWNWCYGHLCGPGLYHLSLAPYVMPPGQYLDNPVILAPPPVYRRSGGRSRSPKILLRLGGGGGGGGGSENENVNVDIDVEEGKGGEGGGGGGGAAGGGGGGMAGKGVKVLGSINGVPISQSPAAGIRINGIAPGGAGVPVAAAAAAGGAAP